MSYEGMAGMRAALGDVSGLIGALGDGEWATTLRSRAPLSDWGELDAGQFRVNLEAEHV
jgi:hypothetical protein